MKKINLAEYHPILSIEKHIVFANNGNVVLCYKGDFPEIYSLSEKDFEDIHGSWFQAFKSLPTSTDNLNKTTMLLCLDILKILRGVNIYTII